MKGWLRPFYLGYVCLSFLVCLLLLFPVFWILGIQNHGLARRRAWWLVHHWSKRWLWFIGMPIQYIGNKPIRTRAVFIANHQSYLDTLDIYAAIPDHFRPLGKIEVGKIPLFGKIYKQLAITVDRSRPESRSRSLRMLQQALVNESSVMIFPEGGFNESNLRLSPFYDGAFRLALDSGVPIQPLVLLDGAQRWHPRKWWALWPGRHRVAFLDPISVDHYDKEDIEGLKSACYMAMDKALESYARMDRK